LGNWGNKEISTFPSSGHGDFTIAKGDYLVKGEKIRNGGKE